MASSKGKSSLLIGTPLPTNQHDEQKLSRKEKQERYAQLPVWQQEVRDEKGRRRLHGAFTGGFSAGYGGTVGSAEGFTPSQFVSSRSNRASVQAQRFEDLLDQEDLDSMGFGKDGIMEKEEYAAAGTSEQDGRRARFVAAGASGSAIPGPIMDDFIGAPRDPIGVKLLKLMGWRPGRSIGSSSSSAAVSAAAAPPRKVYGVAGITPQANPAPSSLVDDDDDIETDDERPTIVASSVGFPLPSSAPSMTNLDEIGLANSDFWLNQRGYGGGEAASGSHQRRLPSRSNNPTDSLVVAFAPKSNTFGIGFDPHENASEFRGRTTSSARSGEGSRGQAPAAGSKVGGAFGYGVFEERDADEIDVYNVDQTSDYDYALDPLPGPKKSSSSFFAKSSVRQDNNDEFQLTATNNCPFKGFARALHQQLPIVEFPPPDIPRDFDPIHKFTEGPSVLTLLDRHIIAQLNPDQRGRLLGEQPLPQNPNARQGPVAQAPNSSAATPSVQPETMAPPRPQPSALPSLLARRFHKEGSGPQVSQDKPSSDENDAGGYQKTAAKLNMFGALTRSVEDWQPERLLCKRFNVRVPNKGAVTSRRDRERGSTNFIGAIDEPMPDADPIRNTSTNMYDNRNESDEDDAGGRDDKDESSPTTMQEGEADESRPSFDLFKAIFEDNEDDAEEQRQAEEAERECRNASPPSSSLPSIGIAATNAYTANDAADEEPLPSSGSSLPATAAEAAPAPFSSQFSERGIIKDFSRYRQDRNSAGKVESDSESDSDSSSDDSSSDSDVSSSSSESDKKRRRHKHKHKHKHRHRRRHSKRSSSREKHRSSRDDRDRSSSSRKHKSHHSGRDKDKDKDKDKDRDRDRERRHKSSSSRSDRRRSNDDSNHKKRKHRSGGDTGSDNDSSSRRADAATSEKKPKIAPVLDLAN